MNTPLKVFITYSHKDLQQNAELKTRLAVMENEGKITLWDDNEILPGDEWYKDISTNLDSSDILLYLVSAASLASKNCNKELAGALEINIRVIPIILENCDWENHQLSCFEVLPHKGKPISKWDHESDGWQNVVDGIRKVVDKIQSQAKSPAGTSEKELLTELAFQHGNVLMMLGQIDKAIGAYSHVITLNPNNAAAYYNRGAAYSDTSDFDRALSDYTEAIRINPNFAMAYNNRGNAYAKKGDYDRAVENFNKAIDINPDSAIAYTNRGAAYSDTDDFDRAIEDFNKAIRINPNFAMAYNNRGNAYAKKGDYDRAIEDYNTAIKLNPNLAEAYYNRGGAYYNKGAVDRAIEDYTKVIELKPDDTEAYNNRGVAYYNKGDFDRAIEDYDTAMQLKPDYGDAYYNRGEARLHLKEWDKARADLIIAKAMEVDIIASFHNDYKNVSDFEGRNGVKLPENIAVMLTSQVTAIKNKEAWEATHELTSDAEIGLDELLENYARAWKTLTKAPQPEGSAVHADLGDLAPKDIEQALQKVRAEAEEERRLDQELDAIPETAYEDVDRFLKTVNKFVPLPDIMPLDNGEICLEWREGQKIFTLSFGGDGHIVFAGIFGARNQARGILTFSMPHLIAVIGMITGLYLHYDN